MMATLLDHIESRRPEPTLRGGMTRVAEVLDRLEAGEPPSAVVLALGLTAADLVSVLAFAALGPGEDDGPPLVRSSPKRPRLAGALAESAWMDLLPRIGRPARLALIAGLAQALDFWDESHHAAQEADDLGESRASAYWHGIAHRREPDPGNAAYWFRRVGRHPVFGTLADSARPLVESYGDSALAARLLRDGSWDPFAMIDLCNSARPGTPAAALARRLQRLEMIALLDATAAGL